MSGNSILKDLEPQGEVPSYLKTALMSEINVIRDSMQVVTLFTEHFLSALAICVSPIDDESASSD